MKTILFNGLGPTDTVSCGSYFCLKNGDVATMAESHANAYIDAKLAVEVENPSEVDALRKLETKNQSTRKRITQKVGDKNESR